MQVTLTLRYPFTLISLGKKVEIPKFDEGNAGNERSFFCEGGNSSCTNTLEINLTISSEGEKYALQPKCSATRTVHQRSSYACTWDNVLRILAAALVVGAKKWKQPKCPSVGDSNNGIISK